MVRRTPRKGMRVVSSVLGRLALRAGAGAAGREGAGSTKDGAGLAIWGVGRLGSARGAVAPEPAREAGVPAAARTSFSRTRPPMPEPARVSMLTPMSLARRRTAGVARALPFSAFRPGVAPLILPTTVPSSSVRSVGSGMWSITLRPPAAGAGAAGGWVPLV